MKKNCVQTILEKSRLFCITEIINDRTFQILCVIATGLVAGPFQQNHIRTDDIHHIALFHVAVCGYILINAILIMSHLLDEQIPKKTVC